MVCCQACASGHPCFSAIARREAAKKDLMSVEARCESLKVTYLQLRNDMAWNSTACLSYREKLINVSAGLVRTDAEAYATALITWIEFKVRVDYHQHILDITKD